MTLNPVIRLGDSDSDEDEDVDQGEDDPGVREDGC